MPNRIFPAFRQLILANPRIWFCGICVLTSFVLLMGLDLKPRHFEDNYFILAKTSFWNPHLYTAPRPFGIYWFYKLARYEPTWVVILQCAYSALVWPFLGLVLAKPFKNALPGFAVIAATSLASLCWLIGGWNFVMLTESLSASSLALFLTCFLLVWQKPNPPRFLCLLVISFYLGIIRDTLPFFIATFAGFCWLWALFQRKVRPLHFRYLTRFLVFSALLLSFSSWSAMLGSRHVFSLYNVLFQRILPNPQHAAWFEAQGLPLNLLLDGPHDWRGQWASSHDRALFTDVGYMPLHHWSIFEGKNDLVHFLMTHPAYVWEHVWRDKATIFQSDLTDYLGPPPDRFIFTVANRFWNFWPLWILIPLLAAYLICLIRGKVSPIPLLISVAAVMNAVLAYHADAMEVPRHCLFTRWALMVATWQALLLVLHHTYDLWKNRTKAAPSHRPG